MYQGVPALLGSRTVQPHKHVQRDRWRRGALWTLVALTFWLPYSVSTVYSWPLSAPYSYNLVTAATVLFWKNWWLPLLISAPPLALGALACATGVRLGFTIQFFLIFGGVAVFLASLNATVLAEHFFKDTSLFNRHFVACLRDCDTPWRQCVTPAARVGASSPPAEAHAAALLEFRGRVFGEAPAVAVDVALRSDDDAVDTLEVSIAGRRLAADVLEGSGAGVLLALRGDALVAPQELYSQTVLLPDPSELGVPELAASAAVLLEAARALRAALPPRATVGAYACAHRAAALTWALATTGEPPAERASGEALAQPAFAEASVLSHALLDAPSVLGFASVRHVGPCGEPVSSLQRRFPERLRSDAAYDALRQPFERDIADLLAPACAGTRLVVSRSARDAWENPLGIDRTLLELRERGCHVEVVHQTGSHACGSLVLS